MTALAGPVVVLPRREYTRGKTGRPGCSRTDCAKPSRVRGLCQTHYAGAMARGELERLGPRTDLEKLTARYVVDPATGCWLWTGSITRYGYGYLRTSHGGMHMPAHRFAYEVLVGPIPDGLELDHLREFCSSRACVKAIADEHGPAHLEPVMGLENLRRGDGASAHALRTNHCQSNHEYTPENTYIRPNGTRACRRCARRRSREWKQRRRAS